MGAGDRRRCGAAVPTPDESDGWQPRVRVAGASGNDIDRTDRAVAAENRLCRRLKRRRRRDRDGGRRGIARASRYQDRDDAAVVHPCQGHRAGPAAAGDDDRWRIVRRIARTRGDGRKRRHLARVGCGHAGGSRERGRNHSGRRRGIARPWLGDVDLEDGAVADPQPPGRHCPHLRSDSP